MKEGEVPASAKTAPYWRLLRGEKVLKSVVEWEDPIAVENLDKLLRGGDIAGQMTFDIFGKFDTIYFMRGKN